MGEPPRTVRKSRVEPLVTRRPVSSSWTARPSPSVTTPRASGATTSRPGCTGRMPESRPSAGGTQMIAASTRAPVSERSRDTMLQLTRRSVRHTVPA